ncbi:MAG: hypothetical protein AABY22_30480 [Nanoarchaeota archaeon]
MSQHKKYNCVFPEKELPETREHILSRKILVHQLQKMWEDYQQSSNDQYREEVQCESLDN